MFGLVCQTQDIRIIMKNGLMALQQPLLDGIVIGRHIEKVKNKKNIFFLSLLIFVSGESCVLAYRASFLWANDKCSRKTNYICERPVQPTNHLEVEEGCDAGWYSFGKRCYKFEMQQKIFYWARDACRQQGAELATVFNEDVNSFVHSKIVEISNPEDHISMWIGMFGQSNSIDGTTTIQMKWAANEPVSYTNWDKGYLNLFCLSKFLHQEF